MLIQTPLRLLACAILFCAGRRGTARFAGNGATRHRARGTGRKAELARYTQIITDANIKPE
jgi:hypothetical protein